MRSPRTRRARVRPAAAATAILVTVAIAGVAGASQAMAASPGPGTNYATPAYTAYLQAHAPADHMGRSLPSHSASAITRAAVPLLQASAADPTYGVDVSAYQGNVNWAQVAANGGQFAYVKATEGTYYTSPYFYSQYNGSKDHGLVRGAYHFAIPSYSSGASQADYFYNNGGGWYASGSTLPGALDIEYNPYGSECYGFSHSAMVSWISQFLGRYHTLTSRWAPIYTTHAWWSACTGNYGGFAYGDPLWIANYGGSAGTLPAGWSFYTFWQYANVGYSPGDQDIFNGNRTALQALAANTTTPPFGSVQGYYSLCLDNFRQGTANGNKIDIFQCNNTGAQHWTMEAYAASNGRYTGWLTNSNGKCMNNEGYGGVGSRVVLWTCVNTANETWTYWPEYAEYSVSYHGHTYCLNDPGASRTPGTQQIVWTCPDTVNEWYTLPH